MKTTMRFGLMALMLAGIASASAQTNGTSGPSDDTTKTTKKDAPAKVSLFRPIDINHMRPADQRGLNMFETPKEDAVPFNGFALSFGGAFTQEFQGIQHSNTAAPNIVTGVNQNQLIGIGHGFNNAVANLNINAQIAPGIRVAMTSYLSARHHQESWVKDGYLLIDNSPIDNALLNAIMKNVTMKVGHFQLDYGDDQARRSDNGNSMYNPFIGNEIIDAFTTEIGTEIYYRPGPFIFMGGITGGEIHGQVTTPEKRSASFLGKLGVDQKLGDDLRFRLTGSFYANNKAASNTLFTGDRGGSPYYDVLENTASTETANAWSGQIRPGFSNKINAEVINPFIKVGGAEFFGSFQTATGGSSTETHWRTIHQNVYEGLYRFGSSDAFYLGARYNTAKGQFVTKNLANQSVDRYQLGGGWFVTPNVLAKLEWVNQKYNDFAATDIRNGGQFKGFMVSGAVGF